MSVAKRMAARARSWMHAVKGRPTLSGAMLVIVAVLLSSAAGLDNGFAYDDLVLILGNPSVHELRGPLAYFGESYWGPERFNHLYRPLTILLFSVEWAIGDGSPVPFHIANVVLYAGSALAVLALARQFMAPLPAVLSALVFAVHPVHVEAIGNAVGQSEPIVAIAILLAITFYVRDRRVGVLRPWSMAGIAALYLVSLFVKEHAVLLPLLLLATEFTLSPRILRQRGSVDVARIRTLVLLLALVLVSYLAIRLSVIGSLAGDSPHPALAALGPGERAWLMLGILPEFVRLLLWPARLYADYSPQLVSIHPKPAVSHLAGFFLLCGWVALVAIGWVRDRRVAFAAVWIPLTLLLAANVIVPTGVLLAERTLFVPSVGVAMLFGLLLAAVWDARPRTLRLAVCVLLVLGAMRSAARQSAWEDHPAVISTMLSDAPDLYRGHLLLGNMYALLGEFELAVEPLNRAVELFPAEPTAQIELALVLQVLGRCEEALRHFERGYRLQVESERGQSSRSGPRRGQLNWAACLRQRDSVLPHPRKLQDSRPSGTEGTPK